jgi:hypothetical protein
MEANVANISNRKFGIEIECISRNNRHDIARALVEAGISCEVQGYNHNTQRVWKIVDDGSLSSGGFELVSPPLSGQEGLKDVETAMRVLVAQGARVDRNCGLHIHVDAGDLTVHDVRNIVKRYHKFEDKIDAVMPNSRRGSNNRYCGTMEGFLSNYGTRMETATSLDRMCDLNERFYKVNLAAYNRHGTIEFRQHSGTVNATKAINWIVFCVTFVETSRRVMRVVSTVSPVAVSSCDGSMNMRAPRRAGRSTTAQRWNKMLDLLEQGGTIAGVAAQTGYEESTLRTYLHGRVKRLGYRIYRSGEVYRIVWTGCEILPVVNRTPRAIDPVDVDPFTALEPEIAHYYSERAMDFAA